MLQAQANLFNISTKLIINRVKEHFPKNQYNYKKHQLEILDNSLETIAYIRFPLTLKLNKVAELEKGSTRIIYISIESDNASVCITENGEITFHTTFSAYMTRKKQGFSQIKYLNKKGKSRAGSRIRLAATIEFFENINTTLTEIFEDYTIDRIAINCTPSLSPLLFNSKIDCPFDKNDNRLYKIPVHIPQSNFTNLKQAIKKLKSPTLFYNPEYEIIKTVLTHNEH